MPLFSFSLNKELVEFSSEPLCGTVLDSKPCYYLNENYIFKHQAV